MPTTCRRQPKSEQRTPASATAENDTRRSRGSATEDSQSSSPELPSPSKADHETTPVAHHEGQNRHDEELEHDKTHDLARRRATIPMAQVGTSQPCLEDSNANGSRDIEDKPGCDEKIARPESQ